MLNLTIEEWNHLIFTWEICFKCETSLNIEGFSYIHEGYDDGWYELCQCISHRGKCIVPSVRDDHSLDTCSIELKKNVVTNYVKKMFSTDDVRSAYKTFMNTHYANLMQENNTTNRLTAKECDKLMACWKICYLCENELDETNDQAEPPKWGIIQDCHCLSHLAHCVRQIREDHFVNDCSLQRKREVVNNYVKKKYSTDNVREAYRNYVEENFPGLVGQVEQETDEFAKLKKKNSELEEEIAKHQQDLTKARQLCYELTEKALFEENEDEGSQYQNQLGNQLIEQNEKLHDEIQASRVESERQREKNEKLHDEIQAWRIENERRREENEKLHDEIQALRIESKRQKEENEKLHDEIQALRIEGDRQTDENEKLHDEIQASQVESERPREENEKLHDEIQASRVENERQREENEKLHDEIQASQVESERPREENEKLHDEIQASQVESERQKEENEKQHDEIQALRVESERQSKEELFEENEDEGSKYQNRLGNQLIEQNEKLHDETQALRVESERQKEENEKLHDEIQTLRVESERQREELDFERLKFEGAQTHAMKFWAQALQLMELDKKLSSQNARLQEENLSLTQKEDERKQEMAKNSSGEESLNMADLIMDECDHLMGVWTICVNCETTIIAFTEESPANYLYGCKCLYHNKCPVPRVRENHSCSLKFKQQVLTNYVKKTFSTDDVRGAYRMYMDNNFSGLMNELNTSDFTKEECTLLIMSWRICTSCHTKVEGGDFEECQCLYHNPECPVSRKVTGHHPFDCTGRRSKMTTVTTYVEKKYNTYNVRRAFKTYMEENLPALVGQISNKTHSYSVVDPLACIDIVYSSDLKFHRRLGAGGYGTVDLMSDEFHTMAVKKLRLATSSKSDELRRELEYLVMVCRHPNLIQIRAILYASREEGTLNSLPIGYCLEHMPEGSLAKVIHGLPRDEYKYDYTQVLNWVRQAACGLHYLHEKSIIHRDVKPDNMLLDRNHLKICDLGVSCIAQADNTSIRGTFVYMAPEVMSVETRAAYSESCDVYSLAISIWEMHHRQKPFEELENHGFTLVENVREGHRPTITRDCNPELSEIINKAWATKPGNRPTMRSIHTFTKDSLRKLGVDIYI